MHFIYISVDESTNQIEVKRGVWRWIGHACCLLVWPHWGWRLWRLHHSHWIQVGAALPHSRIMFTVVFMGKHAIASLQGKYLLDSWHRPKINSNNDLCKSENAKQTSTSCVSCRLLVVRGSCSCNCNCAIGIAIAMWSPTSIEWGTISWRSLYMRLSKHSSYTWQITAQMREILHTYIMCRVFGSWANMYLVAFHISVFLFFRSLADQNKHHQVL